MSLIEIQRAISRATEDDDLLTAPGMCRYSVEKLQVVARNADVTEPKATVSVLVYPGSLIVIDNECIHYALKAVSPDGTLWLNLVPAPGFPQINQIIDCPIGLLPQMQTTDRVR